MKRCEPLALRLCLCLVAAAPAALPTTPLTLSANPPAVDFEYSYPQMAPAPVTVTITASDGSSPTLAVSLLPASGTPAALFQASPIDSTISVGIDTTTLNSLLNLPPAIYTATLTVNAAGFPALTIPLAISVNASLSILATPATLTFNAPSGPTSQTVSLSGSNASSVGFSATPSTTLGGTWLGVTSNAAFTPAILTVTVNAVNLAAGTYTGTVTVTAQTGGASLLIPVTFQVGTNTLIANPGSLTFNFTLSGTAPAPQVLQLTSTLANDTYVAQATSTGGWLLVNGATTNVSGALPASLNVTVNPGNLMTGTYQGSITATDGTGNAQTIPVTLIVGAISLVANPTTLMFVAQLGGAAPASQPVFVNGFGNSTFTAQASGAWLQVSSTGGISPAQINVSANPANLAAGTYSGSVLIDVQGHAQSIQVALIVSANPVLITSPGGAVFSYIGGNSYPVGLTLDVSSSSAVAQTFTVAEGLPSWLRVQTSGSSLTTPSSLAVTLVPKILPTGTYLAQIILTPTAAGAVSTVVPVLLQVSNAPPVTASPTSLTFNATTGGPPLSQTIGVTASSAIDFTAIASITGSGTWLSVSPATGVTGSTPVALTVTVNAASLLEGTYSGLITLTTSIGVVTEVPVSLDVSSGTAPLTISPSSVTFTYMLNGPLPAAQKLQITSGQSFTAGSSGGTWLAVTPVSGVGDATLSVSVNLAGLAPGTYKGTITVTPASGAAQAVPVTLTVSNSTLAAAPSILTFAYSTGNPPPAGQTVSVTSVGAAVQFTATATSSGWLSVSPTTGTSPATLTVNVDASNLGAGSYTGSISLSDSTGTVQLIIQVTLSVTTSTPSITKVTNAASYTAGVIAPGEIVVVFGNSLGPATGVGAEIVSGFIPTTLGNVQVTFNGYAGPILYASATQINAIVPYELAGAANASVEVAFGSARSNAMTIPVAATIPGVFSADASGSGPGAILDLNYHLVSTSNPVSVGSVIQIFATGQGQTNPGGVDGLIEPSVLPLPYPLQSTEVTIGGVPATSILYSGAAPGLVAGALQLDVTIPAGVAPGAAALIVSIGGVSSQAGVTVAVQ